MRRLFRSLLLFACFVGVATSEGWFASRSRQTSPPPAPPYASLVDRTTRAIEQRRVQLEREVARIAEDLNAVLKEKGTAIREAAVKEAEVRRQAVEDELQRLAQEAENLAREKAIQAEQAARDKLVQYEEIAADEAQRLVAEAENLGRVVAAEAEAAARRKLNDLEEAITYKINTFFDRLFYGKPVVTRKLLSNSVATEILSTLRVLVLVSCLGTIFAPQPIRNLWDTEGFGDEFFPFDFLLNKRILAGLLEFGGFMLLVSSENRRRVNGATLVALLFGRGAILNEKRELWQMVFPGTIAALAVTLIVNELVPPHAVSEKSPEVATRWRGR